MFYMQIICIFNGLPKSHTGGMIKNSPQLAFYFSWWFQPKKELQVTGRKDNDFSAWFNCGLIS